MANEATVTSSLQITKGNLKYASTPKDFRATVTGSKGPTPGAITVALAGTKVSLAQLTTPGLCRIANIDSTNYLIYGIFDGVEFYPLGEVLPGEFYVIRLSRYLGRSIGTGVPGTGTYDVGTYSLMLKATVAPLVAVVEAFEV